MSTVIGKIAMSRWTPSLLITLVPPLGIYAYQSYMCHYVLQHICG